MSIFVSKEEVHHATKLMDTFAGINHKGVLEVGDAFVHSKTGQMFLVTEEGISMYSIAEGVKATTAIEDEWSAVEKLIEEEEKLKESEFLKELKEI